HSEVKVKQRKKAHEGGSAKTHMDANILKPNSRPTETLTQLDSSSGIQEATYVDPYNLLFPEEFEQKDYEELLRYLKDEEATFDPNFEETEDWDKNHFKQGNLFMDPSTLNGFHFDEELSWEDTLTKLGIET
ncbi:hypothetical protein HMI56_005266, partial [Coelomomyces lativittatus]